MAGGGNPMSRGATHSQTLDNEPAHYDADEISERLSHDERVKQ